jgi:hypothetical protein
METDYLFETYNSDTDTFDRDFTGYLNGKSKELWKVKSCTYCHDQATKKMFASCLFKRKS